MTLLDLRAYSSLEQNECQDSELRGKVMVKYTEKKHIIKTVSEARVYGVKKRLLNIDIIKVVHRLKTPSVRYRWRDMRRRRLDKDIYIYIK